MADIFDFSNPNAMGLLGAIQGLGQAAMPSRMPVPLGAVLGAAAGGMQQGAMGAQQYQKMAQENALQNLTLQGWRNYLGQGSPAGGSGGGNGTALPPGAKSPIAGGLSTAPGNPMLDLPAMLSQARAGMFPGGPGAQMITPLLSYADTMAKNGYQPIVNPDGSMGVAPLAGIDGVRFMLAHSDAAGKTAGEKQQHLDPTSGAWVNDPGSLESARNSSFATSSGTAAGEMPYKIRESEAAAAASGAQSRLTEAYKTQLENANTTVAVPDGQSGTKLMLKGDANKVAMQNGNPALPETISAKDAVSPSTGTVIPAPTGQIPRTLGNAPNPDWIKEEQSLASSVGPSYQAEQRLSTLAGALKQVQSGSWATDKAAFFGALQAAGIPVPQSKMNDVAAVQTALHENMLTTIETLKQQIPSGSRMTQMEFDRIGKALTNPDLQPEANFKLLTEAIGNLRQNRALAQSWLDAKQTGWSDPFTYQSQWFQKNPTKGFIDQTAKDIGPLKGMPAQLPPGVTQADILAELQRRGLR